MITVRRFSAIASVCLFTGLLVACIQPITAPSSVAANDPVTVFNALHAAINADDIDAALALFAEDAVVQFPNDPTLGVFKGRTEIRKWLDIGAAKNIHVETADLRVTGDTLVYTASVDVDDLRPLGITLVGPAEITVQDGKITALTHVFSDETLAKLQAAAENKPILAVFDLAADSPEQYDQITQALETAGAGSPKGRLYHIAYTTDAGIVVADIWESGALLEQFAQTLVPVVQKLGLTPIQPQIYPIHNLIEATESVDLASVLKNKPIFAVFDPAFESAALYDQLTKDLEVADAGSPKGRLYHIAYAKDGGIVVADVWESGELLEQFAQTLVPVLQKGGVTPIQPQIYPVYNIIRPKMPTASTAEEPATATLPVPALGESPLQITSATVYGQFNGIDYVKYAGHFVNSSNGEAFDAPFEIVTPVEPGTGNGRLIVEPFHFVEEAGARDKFLTPELLFGQGFSHAAICWQTPLAEIKDHLCTAFVGQPTLDLSIIADFARTLKTDEGAKLVGNVDKLYSIGFSNSADPLQRLLLDPLGQHLFDLSFVLTTGWPLPTVEFTPLPADMPASLLPDESAGRVIIMLTEADIVLFNAAALRDDHAHPNYRSYEMAGMSHIPGPLYDFKEFDYLPILRALFVAGDRWITDGIEPPPSAFLEQAAANAIDPVYERQTGIAHDENLNAQGGIHLPDLALGRSQFIAVDTANFVLIGKFIDLKCSPLADGSTRFSDHETYVIRFTREAQRLVEEGFLLPDEADRLIEAAQASDVGASDACA